MPKEHGMIFQGWGVQAIQKKIKTQTRRVIKPQPMNVPAGAYMDAYNHSIKWCFWLPDKRMVNSVDPKDNTCMWKCPYGQPGDRLWVRETFCQNPDGVIYKATEEENGIHQPDDYNIWKPSIHMPRWASRITLEIVKLRVERLQDITEEDAKKEGIIEPEPAHGDWCDPKLGREGHWSYRKAFAKKWDFINAKRGYPWEANPWVWVIEFKVIESN